MTAKERIKRYTICALGLFAMALGITLMVKAGLGTSPISSVPYVLSLNYTMVSLGAFTVIWNLALLLGQVFVLRNKFRPAQLLQIPLTLVFGAFVDFCKWLLMPLVPGSYLTSVAILLLGCLVLALGVSLTVVANAIMNSGEAFVSAVSQQTKREFGTVKVLFDCSLVLLSVLLSLLFFGGISGVREGTVVTAVLSGFIIRFLNRFLRPALERWFTASKPLPAKQDIEL